MSQPSGAHPLWMIWCRWLASRLASSTTSIKTLLRVFSYASRKDGALLAVALIASILAGATLPLMNIIFARLIRTFNSLASTPVAAGNESKLFMSTISRYVLYIIYLFIGRFILAYIAIIGFRITSLRISATIRLRYLEALFRQPISVLDALPPGQTTAIITITANILQLGISERLSSLIQAVTVICTALIIGCIFSWELTLVTASGLVAIACWYSFLTPLVVRKYAAIQEVEREAAGIAHEALSSIRMIAACGADGEMVERYTKMIDKAREMSKNLSPVLAIQHSPVFFTIFATFALCFWYAVRLYLKFQFANVETLVVVLMSAMTMLAHINAVSVPLTAASNAMNAASIFFTIIDAPLPATSGLLYTDISLDADIVLECVNFAYPTRHEVKILSDLSLVFPKGKTTAIVGPSGSGKSTIVALIQRWYELGGSDPVTNYLRNGSISMGDKHLNEIDLHWWRAQIGLVQQDSFLFNDTIAKNVEYGLVGTEMQNAPEEKKKVMIEQACKEAYADDFIQSLPEGYETKVGDKGIQLSGGQRQRIAIARAIIRRPKLLIFDEATSALDVASERIVQAALEQVAQNRTTIVIAHRLSTIKRADKIVVLTKGNVAQEGTHESLLREEGGVYWKLVNAQELLVHSEKSSEDLVIDQKEIYESPMESQVALVSGPEPKSVDTDSRNKFHSFAMLLAEQKQNWVGYLIILIAAVGAASSSPIQAFLFARLISSFAYWGDQLRSTNQFLSLMLVVVAAGIGFSYFTLGWVSNTVSSRTVSIYRKEYFRNIVRKRISFFDEAENSVGLLTARLSTDPSQLQQLLGMNMAMVLISIFGLVGCITIAVIFHWKFALAVIGSSMPIILAGGWYRVRHEVRFESRNNETFADSARFATEAIGAIRTVASLTLENDICRRYDDLLKAHIAKSWKEARVSGIVFAASDSLVLLCMAFALWYGGLLLSEQKIASFNFLVVYLAVIQGSLAAGQWLSFGPNIAQVAVAAERIQAMRNRKTQEDDDRIAANFEERKSYRLSTALLWKGSDIVFEDVWFTYPTRNVPVLQGLNLSIGHGQFAAIVGSSGSGKTTVISLLERFYEPNRGHIYVNDEAIRTLPIQRLRKRMSLVAQDPYLIRGTIRENVLLGMNGDAVSDVRLHAACRDAGIHDFVTSLPYGYDTNIGTSGVALSGGQKQRISIARALIRDPSILLLDEATSSLDSETEKEVQAVFEKTGKGRTMVVVAHRLATIQNADVIFVMNSGRVVERGNHCELLSRRGWYWEMCQAQALGA